MEGGLKASIFYPSSSKYYLLPSIIYRRVFWYTSSVENTTIRLNKFLAQNGLGARRKITDFLNENEVTVNSKRVTEPGIRIDPQKDEVVVNGKALAKVESFVYFLLNKPKGVISSVSDEHGRKTVVDLIQTPERIYPVGRLDANTKGLLILTNDGQLSHKLTHPSFHIDKTYICLIPGKVTYHQISQLQKGIELKEGKTAPAQVKILEERNNRTQLELIIHEGRNHQVKRMLSKIGIELLDLKRSAIGELGIADLGLGQYRELTEEEIYKLKN